MESGVKMTRKGDNERDGMCMIPIDGMAALHGWSLGWDGKITKQQRYHDTHIQGRRPNVNTMAQDCQRILTMGMHDECLKLYHFRDPCHAVHLIMLLSLYSNPTSLSEVHAQLNRRLFPFVTSHSSLLWLLSSLKNMLQHLSLCRRQCSDSASECNWIGCCQLQ